MKPEFEVTMLDKADLPALLQFVKEEAPQHMAFDTETNSISERKALLWGISFCFSEAEAFYLPVRSATGDVLISNVELHAFIKSLTDNTKLIMHNGIYDVLVIENNIKLALTDKLYHDTILSKHLLDEERPFGLKEVSVKYLGPWADLAQKELHDSIKSNGGKTTKEDMEMYKADTAILGKYGAWDAMLTFLLFKQFEPRILASKELTSLFYQEETMPLYKEVVIPMRRHGFPIDVKHFEKIQADIKKDISELEESIQLELFDYVQEFEKTILEKKLKITPRSVLGRQLMERYGYTKDTFPVDPLSTHYEDCYNFFCEKEETKWVFNLASNDHLAWLFFDKLGIPVEETTETGKPKIDASTIEELATDHEFAKKIIDYKKLQKLLGTYINGALERHTDGIVYPSYLMFGTTSGRASMTGLNLQNLPSVKDEDSKLSDLVKKYTNAIRKGFVSLPKHYLADADYESLEPRCFSVVSNEAALQSVFKTGEDFYSAIARDVFNIRDASTFKKDGNFLGKKYPEKRKAVKAFALAAVYGAGAGRIAGLMGTRYQDAQDQIDQYLNAYPNLKAYMENCDQQALKTGVVRTAYGRERHLDYANMMYNKYGSKITNKAWAKSKGLEEVYWQVKNKLNNSKNFPIQGLAAHIVNRAMLAIARKIKEKNLKATVILAIHDQIIVHAHESCIAEVKDIVRDSMENTVKLAVPLRAEPMIATNLADSH